MVIRPDAGEPLTDPRANQTAQDEVEGDLEMAQVRSGNGVVNRRSGDCS